VARDDDNDEEQAGDEHQPRECMACRGTGQVISNLGGSPNNVECPWCRGTGTRIVGGDAQERWPANEEPAPTPPAPQGPQGADADADADEQPNSAA
jgi:hypothetical protein